MVRLRDLLTTGVRRDPTGWLGWLVKPYAALITLGIVWFTTIQVVQIFAMTIVFLGLMLALVFLTTGATASASRTRVPPFDLVAALATIAVSAYFGLNNARIITRITLLDELTAADVVAGTVLLLAALEATRRTVGIGLAGIVMVFLAYNLWGDHLPGPLGHGVIGYDHFLDLMMFTTDGVFGVPVRVALTYVFLFGLFGTFLSRAGGGDFFFDAAAAISGRSPGGPAKIAVVSSGLYGTISGSPTADVVCTGSISIPMMKRLGYPATLAAGIEVAASTGGGILPPVMGSAAFIMAEFTGIKYRDIAVAAIVPALLYYFGVYLQVHLKALKLGLRGLDEDKIPTMAATLRRGGHFLLPLAALIVALLAGYSPIYVAAFGTLAILAAMLLRRESRPTPRLVFEIMAECTLRVVPVVAACAAAGLVVGGLSMTGLGNKVTDLIFLLAGSQELPTLLIAAVITILLGMGMPTPSVYLLAAVLIAPALTKFGIPVLAAHLFLVYYASLSAMTPPVAVAAFAAAPIAEANPLAIGGQAVRTAVVAFLVPFAFVYNPALLLEGEAWRILPTLAAAIAGASCLCLSVEGFWRRPVPSALRLLFAAAGIALVAPSLVVQVAGLAAAVAGAVLISRPAATPIVLFPQSQRGDR